jgi:cytochrome c peroxidase
MKFTSYPSLGVLLAVGFAAGCASSEAGEEDDALGTASQAHHSAPGPLDPQPNPAGKAQTATPTGTISFTTPFHQSLGTNGRSCGTCHLVNQGWTITTKEINKLFRESDGQDPLFRAIDAANSPNADISTRQARKKAYSQILSRGVIRIGRPPPATATAQFDVTAIDDPGGFATPASLSFFRRPLPISNLRFLSTINWDGRSNPPADPSNIRLGLENQSNGATVNHAQAAAPIDNPTRVAIVDFQLTLHHAQVTHEDAGRLDRGGANGGVAKLLTQPFTPGATATPVFNLFDAWEDDCDRDRRDIEDGQRVFNTKTFGPNNGTCAGCHNQPNTGASATIRFFDVGISNPSRRRPDQTLYTFTNRTTGETIQSTDPGRGYINGVWADINKFKVPTLRGAASRAPYFHDGSVETLKDVVDHYEDHFNINFTHREKRNLVKFLESL